MKLYLFSLIILLTFSSCMPSAVPSAATQTAMVTADEKPIVYEIPAWLRDPRVNVLMYDQWITNPKDPYAAEKLSAILLNPLTGQRFDLKLKDGQFYEWIDNQTIGFSPVQNLTCESEMAYSYILSLSSGMLQRNDSGTSFCTVNSSEEIDVSTYDRNVEYYDGTEWVEFIPELPGFYNEYAAVSPDGTTMLIAQGSLPSAKLNRIGIYDFAKGTEIGVFYTENLNAIFQFIGNEHKIAYFDGNIPCILDWNALETECGLPLAEEFYDLELQYVDDGASRIGFIYPGVKSTEGGGRVFCLYDIFEGGVSCPMNELEIFRPVRFTSETISGTQTNVRSSTIISTVISRDEKFVYFRYRETYGEPLRQAVVSMDGKIFFDLGLLEVNGHIPASTSENKWRPIP